MNAEYFERRLRHETDCADVHARLGDDTMVLVDARSPTAHRAKHVPGAVSLPHREITDGRLQELAAGNPTTEFITYCWGPHCNGATKAAAAIAAAGYRVREMLGGIWGWEQEGFRFAGDEVSIEIGLLAFAGFDLLDLGGPYEVLLTANRLACRRGERAPFQVTTIGQPTTAYGGLGITPTTRPAGVRRLDVLIVPGAVDIAAARPDDDVLALAARSDTIASVCTGTFFLQRTGLLDDRSVTTHWEDAEALDHPDVRTDVRWIDHGDLITSGGISSGIAMALHLVERSTDRELAVATAQQIDYVWTERR